MVLKVHFIHGLESSPKGNKARLFDAHFDAYTPAMDTSDFQSCVRLHAAELKARPAQIVIGSSFGGAVLAALIQRGDWPGPALFLAQAALRRGLDTRLPTQAPVWIVHGTRDTVVSVEDSRRLAAANPGGNFRLIEVDDDHSLHTSVDSGALIGWVTSLGDLATD